MSRRARLAKAAPRWPEAPERTQDEESADLLPMADLLLGATAMLVLVVIVLAPELAAPRVERGNVAEDSDASALAAAASAAPVLLAHPAGLRVVTATATRDLSLDAIASLDLPPGAEPLLVVAAEGDEAAFLAEARLAALGHASVRRARLTDACRGIVAIEGERVHCE